jgi:hypothetical protein
LTQETRIPAFTGHDHKVHPSPPFVKNTLMGCCLR